MNKQSKTIKQCVLVVGENESVEFESASCFAKMGGSCVIDFTYHWLTQNGIDEVLLFYGKRHRNQVEEYYEKMWKKSDKKFSIHFMSQIKGMGDVIRQMRFRNIIFQDFMIMFADTMTNFPLRKMIEQHFKNKQLKNVISTTAVQIGRSQHLHVVDPESMEILQIEKDTGKQFVVNPLRINLKKMSVEFRRDLRHCEVYMCTAEVFRIFKETFEYNSMFDFMNGMLTSDVYDDKIVGYMLPNTDNCYRVNTPKHYYIAYKKFICRYFDPYTLDFIIKPTKHKQQQKQYFVKRFNQIHAAKSSVALTAKLSNNCYVGFNSKIGENCTITHCIVCDNCIVGDNAQLSNCIILDNCEIPVNSMYENCLVEKINQSQSIRSYESLSRKESIELVQESLFEDDDFEEEKKTVNQTLEEEIKNLLSGQPDEEIMKELFAVRKRCNKSLKQFTFKMFDVARPEGNKALIGFLEAWGGIIYKIHDKNQKQLLYSILYTCQNIESYSKAFPHFLLFFYNKEIITFQVLESWYPEERKKQDTNSVLSTLDRFYEQVSQQQEEESDEQDESD